VDEEASLDNPGKLPAGTQPKPSGKPVVTTVQKEDEQAGGTPVKSYIA
jgi:hypothetical protein